MHFAEMNGRGYSNTPRTSRAVVRYSNPTCAEVGTTWVPLPVFVLLYRKRIRVGIFLQIIHASKYVFEKLSTAVVLL